MNRLLTIGATACALLLTGCGDSNLGEECDKAMNAQQGLMRMFSNQVRTYQVIGADIDIRFNAEDELYYQCYHKFYTEPAMVPGLTGDFAFAKRKAALNMSREVFCYSFKNYILLDGVSGIIYNASYIMQVPHKLLRGLRSMDGIFRYATAVVKLAAGTVCAIVGLVASPVINTICHPFETLSNLSVGVVSACVDMNCPISWLEYVARTNILYSLWDLIWGAIVYPIVQAAIFFM